MPTISLSPKAIPLSNPQDEAAKKTFETSADQSVDVQERQKRIWFRLNAMLEFKRPYEVQMERCFLLYDGISRLNPREPPVIEFSDVVQPWAAIFVETKTTQEFLATSDFEFLPLNDEDDTWKVKLNMDCVEHVRRKTNARANKLDGLRIKNIAGVSIKRKGYRLIMRTLKTPTEEDEFGRMIKWQEDEVPWYDDLFEELVDPFDFVVDPNATNMNNAVDCGQFHRMNWEDAYELFGKDRRFDFEGVKPGLDNMVEFFEYFNAPRDEWVIYAWPSTGARYSLDHDRRPATSKEVYFGPLPDKHKMLPFTSQHTNPSFITGFFFEVIGRSPETGEETSHGEQIIGHRTFWTPGIPVQIADLIDIRTSYGRQALEALKAAATNIVLTDAGYRFNNKKKWKNGEQAIGMKGHAEILQGESAHVQDFEFHFNDILQQMIQRIGVDPRNIDDAKQKTLGQDQAERESAAMRLNAEIEYNEIIEGVRDGLITYKLIQQYYTRPEVVRLSGNESADEIANFDETMGVHPIGGGPMVGKRYRRISSKSRFTQIKKGGKNMLQEKSDGTSSFPARPEFILTSEVDIIIVPKRRAGELKSVIKQQASDDLQLILQLLPFAQPNNQTGQPPIVTMDQLPSIDRVVKKWVEADGGNPQTDIGQNKSSAIQQNIDKAKSILSTHQPFNKGMGGKPSVSPPPQTPLPPQKPTPQGGPPPDALSAILGGASAGQQQPQTAAPQPQQ